MNSDIKDEIHAQDFLRLTKTRLGNYGIYFIAKTGVRAKLTDEEDLLGLPTEQVVLLLEFERNAVLPFPTTRQRLVEWVSNTNGEFILPNDFVAATIALAEACKSESRRKPGRKQGIQREKLEEVLKVIESWATNEGRPFDRASMPGPLGNNADDEGSFHWMAAKLSPLFRVSKSAFEKHRANFCQVAPRAPKSDFYRDALPHIAQKLGVSKGVSKPR